MVDFCFTIWQEGFADFNAGSAKSSHSFHCVIPEEAVFNVACADGVINVRA